jgi:hypothetical protein
MKPSTLARLGVLGLAALLACGASPDPGGLRGAIDRLLGGAPAPKQDAAPIPAPRTPREDAPLPNAMSSRRFAGGRSIAWWSERLTRLRREGPEDLYRLTLERARLNSLDVAEGANGEVTVGAPPVAGARP